jgi:hypothetical protein
LKLILEPLAIANNVTQANYTRLDHVLLTLGNLYKTYSTMTLEQPIRDSVINSLEKRWAAADQDIFILSLLFHPWIRGRCFTNRAGLSRMDLFNMAERVFQRVFEEEPDYFLFMSEFTEFLDCKGRFSDEMMRLDTLKANYAKEVSSYHLSVLLAFTNLI